MKHTLFKNRNTLLLLGLFLSLFSCSKEDNEPPFYKFTNSDYEYIPTLYEDVGAVFTFKNELNEEVKIKVLDYTITKKSGGGLSGFFVGGGSSMSYHYFEKLEIDLEIIGVISPPKRISLEFYSVYKADPSRIGIWIHLPYFDGGFSRKNISPPFDDGLGELIIEGNNYNKVKSFNNSYLFFKTGNNYPIDKVYYDFKHGLIGFDDTENNIQFRLVN